MTARDVGREFRCGAGEIGPEARVQVARLKASVGSVRLVNSKLLSMGSVRVRNTGATTSFSSDAVWGRCPLRPEECEPQGQLNPGDAVVIWKSVGAHRCVTHADVGGWIAASHLEQITATRPKPIAWVGAYTRGGFNEIAIGLQGDGALAVSGALIASAGEEDNFSVFNLNEIGLTKIEPKNGLVVLPYRIGISATDCRGITEYSGGEPGPAGCALRLRINPPLLVVKDSPGCVGDRSSGFEGIWFPDPSADRSPRAGHAKAIQLGR